MIVIIRETAGEYFIFGFLFPTKRLHRYHVEKRIRDTGVTVVSVERWRTPSILHSEGHDNMGELGDYYPPFSPGMLACH
jgi:hypothetical protein